jgi:hypothetical protein
LQTLRFLNERPKAFAFALDSLDTYRDSAGAKSEALAALADMSFEEVADGIIAIRRKCATFTFVRAECLVILTNVAVLAARSNENDARARSVFEAALDLGPAPRLRQRLSTYVAATFANGALIDMTATPRVRVNMSRQAIDSANYYLDTAQSQGDSDPLIEEWTFRLRALVLQNELKFREAYQAAKSARDRAKDPNSVSLMAQSLFMASVSTPVDSQALLDQREAQALLNPLVDQGYGGAYSLFVSVNHELGQDSSSLTRLRARGESYRDYAAFHALTHLCNQIKQDFKCGYDAVLRTMTLGLRKSPLDSLDAVEAAVLADSTEMATRWLARLPATSAFRNCYQPLPAFFSVWAQFARGKDVAKSFQEWVGSVGKLSARELPNQCWQFNAVAYKLRSLPREQEWRVTLRGMLARMISITEMPKLPRDRVAVP